MTRTGRPTSSTRRRTSPTRSSTWAGASRGDKTLLDALLPFVDELRGAVDTGAPLVAAWETAARVAVEQAEATADLTPKVGRARP
ncbi:DAK2 domain-containing protein, partial [Pseudomonas viridiflava]|uniref:DAK2 domain-containing protein n=1 Tax=Pseudomonas viridiflava TaxID=33069 RepID=UPI0019827159